MDVEQFAAARKDRLTSADEELRPLVARALEDRDWGELADAAAVLWLEIFERGAPRAYAEAQLAAFRKELRKHLAKTSSTSQPPLDSDVQRVTYWLGTYTVNDATFHANRASGQRQMRWVSMHDGAVRETHVKADGQIVSVNATFEVGGYKLRYPGEPVGPPEIWMNCRCLVAGGKVRAVTAAAVKEAPVVAEPIVDEEIEDDGATVEEEVDIQWHAVLAPMGVATGDGREFALGSLTHRDLPLPLTYQIKTAEGHDEAVVVGKIDEIEYVGNLARGRGTFWGKSEYTDTVIDGIATGYLKGVSVDVDDVQLEVGAGTEVSEEDAAAMMDGTFVTVFSKARISGLAIVHIPAYQEAYIALGPDFDEDVADVPQLDENDDRIMPDATPADEDEEGLAAAGFAPGTKDGPGWLTNPDDTARLRRYWTKGAGALKIKWGTPGDFNRCRSQLGKYVDPMYLAGTCANLHKEATGTWPGIKRGDKGGPLAAEVSPAFAFVAAAVKQYDAALFADPELDGPTALTITDDGHVFGHVATWGTCHIGVQGACTTAPHSNTGYAYYRTGVVDTTDGPVSVGQITMGTGHASLGAKAAVAAAHYDNTGASVADVAAGEDSFGIWVSGVMRDSATEEQRHALRAGALSGDWRLIGGNLEMVAALAVNVPGFPIPRTALAASAGVQESLVATDIVEQDTLVAAGGKLDAETIGAIARTAVEEYRHMEARAARRPQVESALATIRRTRIAQARARLNEQ
jgi:hypothetical protein